LRHLPRARLFTLCSIARAKSETDHFSLRDMSSSENPILWKGLTRQSFLHLHLSSIPRKK
jgi:hypothetical protein